VHVEQIYFQIAHINLNGATSINNHLKTTMSKRMLQAEFCRTIARICGLELATLLVTNLVILIRPFFKLALNDIIIIRHFMLMASGA